MTLGAVPLVFLMDLSHQYTGAPIVSMRFWSGELLRANEFGGYLTTVSETVPVKLIGWLGCCKPLFSGYFTECLQLLAGAVFYGAGFHF